MNSPVRVRFAPSPTGGLHLGGIRTALYNYLYAKKHKGTFVLRIEDTDQSRFVAGAEDYIFDCLEWCGLTPDESVRKPGNYGPYRQSERKANYLQYAQKLVETGHAYYAFDTPEDLEHMRKLYSEDVHAPAQYDYRTRDKMKNALTLSTLETQKMIADKVPYVIRIKIPQNEVVTVHDSIRGELSFETNQVDDKVLIKADGMPTYHLAVVVDDYLMKITHAFRGEEWLPSAPVHLLLWKYLGWEKAMPQWAHLPLILKPDGHGKLSKRDGDRLGFPVFALNWKDPKTQETASGFKESGFLPEAFINMLALLGWNPGREQEIFSKEELIEAFSLERVHKSGAKFDFEKAKWFNHQYIQLQPNAQLAQWVRPFLSDEAEIADEQLEKIVGLVKERCFLLSEFQDHSHYFFSRPLQWDTSAIAAKWSERIATFFTQWQNHLAQITEWNESNIETSFNKIVVEMGMKKGEVMLPFRVMLVGGKYGVGVFIIAAFIGQQECLSRMRICQEQL